MRRVARKLVFLVAILVFAGVAGAAVMLLWNALLPSIFGLRAIGFWEGLGLLVLARLLFGGFHGRGHWHWRHRMRERWAHMTPEERAKFKEGLRERCGGWHHGHEEPKSPAQPG
jgi:hypothetical protein